MTQMLKKIVVAISVLVGVIVTPTAASAAGRDGTCDSGEFCY